jgi:hypothetical protein
MKARHYLLTGAAAYILFLINTLPASIVVDLLNDSVPQLNISSVDGTIWDGTAQRITITPDHTFDNTSWSFCTWRLLTAETSIDIKATYQNSPVQGQLGIGITGNLIARNLHAEIDARPLGKLAGLPLGELSGLISLQLESATWVNKKTPGAIGNIYWKNAAITIAEKAELGDIKISLAESDDFPVAATINNKGGQLSLSGETHISDDGSYNLELKLSPNNTASKNLESSLKMFAEQQSDGSFIVKNTGNLKQFGIL